MKKILIADELSFGRELLSFALRQHGYEVVTAEDGPGAVDGIKRGRPDLVILDSRLPRIDGLSVMRLVRSIPECKELPVIMLDAGENRHHLLLAIQSGVQEYILKSQFDLELLLARIRKCLGMSGVGVVAKAPARIEEVRGDVTMAAASTGRSAVPFTPVEIEGEIEAASFSSRSASL